jgi:hypothetical protein
MRRIFSDNIIPECFYLEPQEGQDLNWDRLQSASVTSGPSLMIYEVNVIQ